MRLRIKIIYVELTFCNYFTDIHYERVIPKEHLPIGFDAKSGNPYREEYFVSVKIKGDVPHFNNSAAVSHSLIFIREVHSFSDCYMPIRYKEGKWIKTGRV